MSMDCKAGMAFFPTANFMLQTPPPPPPPHHDHQDHAPPHHHIHPSTSSPHLLTSWFPQDYHGTAATTTSLLGKRSMSFMGYEEGGGNGGDDELSSEDIDGGAGGGLLGEKKKRLSIEQVRTLEKSFELHGNKLEPERKLQLAKAIGLQPRQVAIWFQNRRARWKTKQLEKEYDILKRHFDSVKADNDALHSQNRKLHAEIMALKGRDHPSHDLMINLNKESEGSGSNRSSENSSDLKLNFSSTTPPSSITEHEHVDPPHHPIPMSRQLFPVPSGLTNMFPNIDDNSGFWPWLDQHQHLNN